MEIYHVLNRGVDKRCIVQDDFDRMRFMQGLYMYNNTSTLGRNSRRKPLIRRVEIKRDPLVHIHAFCLMDNHYHLLLSPVNENEEYIPLFMQKLNMGYSKYFNEKYQRKGALWQGKYKSVHINNDSHFNYIPYYIHLNPLDMKCPEWRNGTLHNTSEAMTFLKTYRWSSFLDYYNIPNYPSILDQSLFINILGSTKRQLRTIQEITTDTLLANTSTFIEDV